MSDDGKLRELKRDEQADDWPRDLTRGPRDNSEVRLYVRMDCSEADAEFGSALFKSFAETLTKEFPKAQTLFRRGPRVYLLEDGDEENMFVRRKDAE